jgi:RNA polymerase sigma-70 factor (ECF subfamily)
LRSAKERALDTYLAAAARTGDRKAMGRLAERWHARLVAHAYRLTGERTLAADAAQDAWTDILRGLASLDDAAAFPAWAFRIVSRRCARVIRGRQHRRAGTQAFADDNASRPATSFDPADGSDLDRIRTAMAELPPDQRAAMGLFYLEGLHVAEIAAALDTPPGTIKTRLMHARNKLRALLQGDLP